MEKTNVVNIFGGNKNTGICDKCGENKEILNGRCDDCFEIHGDPIDEISKGVSAFAFEETKPEPVQEEKTPDPEPVLLSSGQFSLFDFAPIVEEPKKVESGSDSCDTTEKPNTPPKASGAKSSSKPVTNPASTGTTPAVKPKAAKKQDLEVEEDWTVHYATQTFRVGDFFNPFPASGKVKLELLRQQMEMEFFEMTQQRTKWDYDEELKRLYPDVTGTSKGGQ